MENKQDAKMYFDKKGYSDGLQAENNPYMLSVESTMELYVKNAIVNHDGETFRFFKPSS